MFNEHDEFHAQAQELGASLRATLIATTLNSQSASALSEFPPNII